MGKIIRRTVTITITESWTIVWTDDGRADDKPQTTTIVSDQPNTQEEPDETIVPTVTTVAATEPQPNPKLNASRQRKRTYRRRVPCIMELARSEARGCP